MVKAMRLAADISVAAVLAAALAGVFAFDILRPSNTDPAHPVAATGRRAPVKDTLLTPKSAAATSENSAAAPVNKPPEEVPQSDQVALAKARSEEFQIQVPTDIKPEPALETAVAPPVNLPPVYSQYSQRTAPERKLWIEKLGGSPLTEKSVHDGLAWLARHQAKDGSWCNRCLGSYPGSCCEPESKCSGEGQSYEMAQTGLALLAFQAGGHYGFNAAEYSQTVKRGLDWIVKNQQHDGSLVGSMSSPGRYHSHFMYEHGIATLALAESCAISLDVERTPDSGYTKALAKAVRFIETGQHRDGGWRYTRNLDEQSDASVSGWQVLALKTAISARIPVDSGCLRRLETFFRTCEIGNSGQTSYLPRQGAGSPALTGVGMLVHEFLLNRRDTPLVKTGADFLADLAKKSWGDPSKPRAAAGIRAFLNLPRTRTPPDYYLWYNCTLAMFHAGGEPWKRWNEVVPDVITGLQEQSGCARGSWPPTDTWGTQGGRIYSTSLAILTLEVYYRFANVSEAPRRKVVESKPQPAVESRDETAEKKLQLARQLFDAGRLEPARARFHAIIKEFPDTEAARQADKLLQKMTKD